MASMAILYLPLNKTGLEFLGGEGERVPISADSMTLFLCFLRCVLVAKRPLRDPYSGLFCGNGLCYFFGGGGGVDGGV